MFIFLIPIQYAEKERKHIRSERKGNMIFVEIEKLLFLQAGEIEISRSLSFLLAPSTAIQKSHHMYVDDIDYDIH
jgi:hypothetical protein